MKTFVPIILGLVLAAAVYFVLSNSHVDIFPCMKIPYSNEIGVALPMESGTCDLLTVRAGEGALTAAGYAVEGGVLLVPMLLGLWLGRLLTRPKTAASPTPLS